MNSLHSVVIVWESPWEASAALFGLFVLNPLKILLQNYLYCAIWVLIKQLMFHGSSASETFTTCRSIFCGHMDFSVAALGFVCETRTNDLPTPRQFSIHSLRLSDTSLHWLSWGCKFYCVWVCSVSLINEDFVRTFNVIWYSGLSMFTTSYCIS